MTTQALHCKERLPLQKVCVKASILIVRVVAAMHANGKPFPSLREKPRHGFGGARLVPRNERHGGGITMLTHRFEQSPEIEQAVPPAQDWIVDDQPGAFVTALPARITARGTNE